MKNTVVYTTGRLNPPTSGHAKLVRKVRDVAKKHNGDAIIYMTTSHDSKKNPLKFEQKVYFMKRMFRDVTFNTDKKLNNPFTILGDLLDKYEHVIFVVGGDRVQEFKNKMESHTAKNYPNNTFEVISAGERAALKVGNEDVSGSFMRKYAEKNDYETFSKGLPEEMSKADAKKLFTLVRTGMGLTK